MISKQNSTLHNEKGVSFIEMAISLPLIVIFVAGIIDYGVGLRTINSISAASRAGARFAAKHSAPVFNMSGVVANPPACGTGVAGGQCSGPNANISVNASITDAAFQAACNYLHNDGLGSGFLVDVDIENTTVANLQASISNPNPTTIKVTVRKDSGGDANAKFCLVCAEHFVPGMKADSIKSEATFLLDGSCGI